MLRKPCRAHLGRIIQIPRVPSNMDCETMMIDKPRLAIIDLANYVLVNIEIFYYSTQYSCRLMADSKKNKTQ